VVKERLEKGSEGRSDGHGVMYVRAVYGRIGFRVTDRPGWLLFIHHRPILPPAEMPW